MTLHKTLIKSFAFDGQQTWTLRKEDEQARGGFERKVQQQIFYGGVRTVQNLWRRRMNHELQVLPGDPTIKDEGCVKCQKVIRQKIKCQETYGLKVDCNIMLCLLFYFRTRKPTEEALPKQTNNGARFCTINSDTNWKRCSTG